MALQELPSGAEKGTGWLAQSRVWALFGVAKDKHNKMATVDTNALKARKGASVKTKKEVTYRTFNVRDEDFCAVDVTIGGGISYRYIFATINGAKMGGIGWVKQFFSPQTDKTKEETREIGYEGCGC